MGTFPQSKNKYRARFKNWTLSNTKSICFKRVVLFDLKFCGEGNCISQCQHSQPRAWTHTDVNISTTSLKYNIHTTEETEKQQQLLEQHITIINKHIQQNTSYDFRTKPIAHYTLKTTKGKQGLEEKTIKNTHFVYSRLYGGVHFKTKLKQNVSHIFKDYSP